MEICDRCHNSIVGDKSVKAHRKDGSSATLCLDCASELKKNRNQNPRTKDVPVPPPTAIKEKENQSGDKWYKTIGIAFLCIIFVVLLYFQLNRLESGEISSVRVWWPVVIMYNTLGFWGAVSCPGILALLFFGLGIKQLIDSDQQSNK